MALGLAKDPVRRAIRLDALNVEPSADDPIAWDYSRDPWAIVGDEW
jgi:hypothetical protein